MPERASPLAQCHPSPGLSQQPCALLLQYHAWPQTYVQMAAVLAARCGVSNGPSPGKAVSGAGGSLLRIHPQRLWLLSGRGSDYPVLDPEIGATLDLSHARTIIHVSEGIAVPLLSRFIAVDLRPHRFAIDDVVTTPLHRVSVVLWRRADGIDILAPRSFARSIWEVLAETAERLA
jgi:heterotetrameric sarcosine oxidase gamma subunit